MRVLSRRQLRRLRRRAERGAAPSIVLVLLFCTMMGVTNLRSTSQDFSAPPPATVQGGDSPAHAAGKSTSDPKLKKIARMAAEASGGRYTASDILEKADRLQALGVRRENLERYVPEKVRASLKFRELKGKVKGYARQVGAGGAAAQTAVSVEPPLGMIEIGVAVSIVIALLFASSRAGALS